MFFSLFITEAPYKTSSIAGDRGPFAGDLFLHAIGWSRPPTP